MTPQTFNSSHSLRFSIHGNVFVASLFWKRTIHSPSNTTAHALHGIITNYITLKPNQNPKTHDHTYIYIFKYIYTYLQNLTAGNKVVLPGFETFEPRTRSARKGRNPKTGAEIDIQASIGAGFSPAKALKDKLNGRGE